MKRRAVRIATAAVFAAAWIGAVSGQTVAPSFSVEQPRLDLGEVKGGTEVVATFVFHNQGAKDVRIIQAKPT
jgi:hypothetical protein